MPHAIPHIHRCMEKETTWLHGMLLSLDMVKHLPAFKTLLCSSTLDDRKAPSLAKTRLLPLPPTSKFKFSHMHNGLSIQFDSPFPITYLQQLESIMHTSILTAGNTGYMGDRSFSIRSREAWSTKHNINMLRHEACSATKHTPPIPQ